jgi:acetate kinase
LLGISGLSADSRELAASNRPEAREALDLFAFRIAGEAARLATTLGGLDCFVFTAGVGEHLPGVASPC